MYNEFENLVLSRQSCRDFSDKKVEKEKIEKITKLARLTPSACNSQPWKIYAVSNDETRAKVIDAVTEGGRNLFAKKAPVFFALVEKDGTLKEDVKKKFSSDFFVKYDIGELIAYITLTAKSLGLDTCILGWVNAEKMGECLNLSQGEACHIVIATGYSNIAVREKNRLSESQVIFYK